MAALSQVVFENSVNAQKITEIYLTCFDFVGNSFYNSLFGWCLRNTPKNSFVSDVFLNLAFTILSGILVAVLLAKFLDVRERERWATFDRNNLIDLRDVLYQLLYEVLHIPTHEACVRTKNDFVSDAFDYMLAEYRRDSAKFLAYLGAVKKQLDNLYG